MRCSRSNGKWRCTREATAGKSYCAEHRAAEIARDARDLAARKSEAPEVASRRRAHAAKAARDRRASDPAVAKRGGEQCRKWHHNNPPGYNARRGRELKLRAAYGITIADFDRMLADQGGACAICRTTKPLGVGTFHVDHDHATNSIRGLLCHHCNIMLGNAGDSAERLRLGADYLDRHTQGIR